MLIAQSPRHQLNKNRSNANINHNTAHTNANMNANTNLQAKFQYGSHTGNKISLAKFGGGPKEYHH
jgi:hypothetical protein